ncbi:MAG: ATP-binding protein [Pseudomonadota bacterium]
MNVDTAQILEGIETAVWIYDFTAGSIIWSNPAAQRLWEADSAEDLAARDLTADMSESVAAKLQHYREDFRDASASVVETWSFYPKGIPHRVKVKCRGVWLNDDAPAMLVEVIEQERSEADNTRSVEALLHTTVMISLYSEDGTWLYGNPAARAAFGGGVHGLTERIVPSDAAEAFKAELYDKGSASLTAEVRRSDGVRWHEIVGKLCRDAVTGRRALLISESDVTAVQTARFAHQQAEQAAIEATQQKTEFLTTMSHELRTPINSVLGVTELLDAKLIDPEHRALLDMIKDAGQTLLKTITGILDLSKIEEGQLVLEQIEFRPSDLVPQLRSIHGAAAGANETRLTLSTTGSVEQPRLGDPHRIEQVLNNLIGNAIRFTRGGEVLVEIACQTPDALDLKVSDTGLGMTEDQSNRIFEKFAQAETATARTHGGSGLGLAITRGLVEAMGGQITLTSAPNQGTTVTVTLPHVPLAQSSAPTAAMQTAATPPDGQIRVLAAEDDMTNQMVLRGLLSTIDIVIDIASSGEEALDHYRAKHYDLLMLDINMTRMDGMQTLQAIRAFEADSGRRETPAIAVTANVFHHQIESYLKAGFQAHLGKPLRSQALADCIDQTLRRARAVEI